MEDRSKFISLELKRGGKVKIGDNTTCEVLNLSIIDMMNFLSIKNVLLIDGLKYNLFSIS